MGCLEVLESIASVLSGGLKIKDSQGIQTDPATETTLQAIQSVLDLESIENSLQSIESDVDNIKDFLEAGSGEIFYPYYDAGIEEVIDGDGVVISEQGFNINKTMVGNIGEEIVYVQLGAGALIPVPVGGSLNISHDDVEQISFVATTAGSVVWVIQGLT